VTLAYRTPSSLHPDSDAIGMATEVLGDTPNGRLYRALVQPGLAHRFSPMASIRASLALWSSAPGQQGRSARSCSRPDDRGGRGRLFAQGSRDRRRTRSCGRAGAHGLRAGSGRPGGLRGDAFRVHRARRLAALLLRPRSTRPDQGRRSSTLPPPGTSCATTACSAPSSPTIRRSAPWFPRRRLPPQLLANFKPQEKGDAGEAFDPSYDNLDRRTRLQTFGDLKLRCCRKGTAGKR
jgi:zinc protease